MQGIAHMSIQGPAVPQTSPESAVTTEDLLSAWDRVLENSGCAGTDGVTVLAFQKHLDRNIALLLDRLAHGLYRPWPLLKIVIQKKPDSPKMRTLLVPAVVDRLLQTAVARQLSRSFEQEFLECSYGYRPGRSVDRAIARIRKLHREGFEYVVDADIHTFFDEVDHALLLQRLAPYIEGPLRDLVYSWVNAELWTGERIQPVRKGVPQGSPISPLFANFFLEEFDRHLELQDSKLIRYADDFLILSRSREASELQLRLAETLLHDLHLKLAVDKTHLTSFAEGFRFLGAFFQQDGIWTPWKSAQRTGKILFAAKPLPARLRGPYQSPVPRGQTQMERAFRHIGELPHRDKPASPATPHSTPGENHDPLMPFLYLTDQGSILRKAGDRLLVEKAGEIILDLPYHKLDSVVVFGNVQVTTQALGELLEKGIPLHFLSRAGEYRGSLLPPRGAQVELRLRQFETYQSGSMPWAREFIAAKLANADRVLTALRSHQDPAAPFEKARDQVTAGAAAIAATESLESLLGVEGAASKAYFQALWLFNKSDLHWPGRLMHPATDPLNALLSLAYTLLTQELTGLLEAAGLDPYLGFLHQIDYNRPSLALDLIEPFRYPIVDRLVLRTVNLRQFQADDFVKKESNGALHLNPLALNRFLAEYEQALLGKGEPYAWRDVLREEVRLVARALRERSEFKAFRFNPGASRDQSP